MFVYEINPILPQTHEWSGVVIKGGQLDGNQMILSWANIASEIGICQILNRVTDWLRVIWSTADVVNISNCTANIRPLGHVVIKRQKWCVLSWFISWFWLLWNAEKGYKKQLRKGEKQENFLILHLIKICCCIKCNDL